MLLLVNPANIIKTPPPALAPAAASMYSASRSPNALELGIGPQFVPTTRRSYGVSSSRAGIRFCPSGPKSKSSILRQKLPQACVILSLIPLTSPVQECRIRTLAPPLNLDTGRQAETSPSWKIHRYSQVSSRPGSSKNAESLTGFPSSAGLGSLSTSLTVGATLLISRSAVSLVVSGRMRTSVHLKSISGMKKSTQNVDG